MEKTEEEKDYEFARSNDKMIVANNLNEIKVRLPRSRAPVLISLPPKIDSIDFDENESDYLKLDASFSQNTPAFNNNTYISNKNNLETNKGICGFYFKI